MTIREAMTADVITVRPEDSVHKAARLMADHGVSGLPVVNEDARLVGMISEGDLILRHAGQRPRPWWHRFFEDADAVAREYRRATGVTVSEVMTRAVVSVSPVFDLQMASRILLNRGLRRLPVVEDGRLIGIISRGDLVKALAATLATSETASDGQLVQAMRGRMAAESWTSGAPPAG